MSASVNVVENSSQNSGYRTHTICGGKLAAGSKNSSSVLGHEDWMTWHIFTMIYDSISHGYRGTDGGNENRPNMPDKKLFALNCLSRD